MREREPYEDFLAVTVRRPGFEPWNLRVVIDPAGEVVGTAMLVWPATGDEGYIERLAVRRTSAARGWPRRCSSTPSQRRRRTARHGRALDRLAHRRARPLREGRHGGHDVWVNRAIDL